MMSGWRGMDEAIEQLRSSDPEQAVDLSLADLAEHVVATLRETWPTKTGASREAWRADGADVRNDRPETSNIGAGLADKTVPGLLSSQEAEQVMDQALEKHMGIR